MSAYLQGRPPGGIGLSWLGPLVRNLHQAGLRHALVVVDDLVDRQQPELLGSVMAALDALEHRKVRTCQLPAERPAAAHTPALIVGVGGGTAMDLAKFASWQSAGPSDIVAASGGSAGIIRPRWERPGDPLILVPTTLGTGSEVSSPAITWRAGNPYLVHGPAQQTRFFLLEPTLLEALPAHLVNAGAFEIWCRLVCASVDGPVDSVFANAEANRLTSELEDLIDQLHDDPHRRRSALLRVLTLGQESILGWALAGRGEQAFRLWYPAMEWAALCGSTKVEALVDLLPSWAATRSTASAGLRERCDRMIAKCELAGSGTELTGNAANQVYEATLARWFSTAGNDVRSDVQAMLHYATQTTVRTLQETRS